MTTSVAVVAPTRSFQAGGATLTNAFTYVDDDILWILQEAAAQAGVLLAYDGVDPTQIPAPEYVTAAAAQQLIDAALSNFAAAYDPDLVDAFRITL